MMFCYIDESYDSNAVVFTALVVPAAVWTETFEALRERRRVLREKHGIFMRKELHAREFVSGRGRIADRTIFKGVRAAIFREQLQHLASLRVRVFNAVFPAGQKFRAFERLVNRINRTMQP